MGLSTTMSPKARINTLLGYTPPFDRHDWVVDRCGRRVDYIIDFYAGRDEGKGDGKLNFFLDVRPKLNTWEGWKMRAAKTFGIVQALPISSFPIRDVRIEFERDDELYSTISHLDSGVTCWILCEYNKITTWSYENEGSETDCSLARQQDIRLAISRTQYTIL